MVVKRNLDGAVDKSSADQEIRKSEKTLHNLFKNLEACIRSYGGQAGWLSDKILGMA